MKRSVRSGLVALAVAGGMAAAAGVAAQAPAGLEVAPASGLETGGAKDGGVAWGDFDADGCPDAAVNTDESGLGTRIYRQDTSEAGCSASFVDVTEEVAPGLAENVLERSVVWGDIDDDGNLDLVRNSFSTVEVYRNTGPPTHGLALTQTIDRTSLPGGGINTEGMGLIDYDGDGDLDLVVDGHEFGVLAFANRGGNTPFEFDPDSGLPYAADGAEGDPQGDYLAVADYDGDGDVDLVARRRLRGAAAEFGADVFRNDGGVFTAGQDVLDAPDRGAGGKGAVALCDFDNDLDLDVFWTDGDSSQDGVNSIWLQAGVGSGEFAPSGLPGGIAGDVDGVSCGDVDNDGDVDFVLTTDGDDHLYVNQLLEEGALGFVVETLSGTAADGEGSSLADIDRDGDLDLVVNQSGGNVLLTNALGGSDALVVDLREGPRAAIGATVWLERCDGTAAGGLAHIDGGSGHGSQNGGLEAHFGLGAVGGAESPYVVAARFVGGDIVRIGVRPGELGPDRRLTVAHGDSSDTGVCAAAFSADATVTGELTAGETSVIEIVVSSEGGTPLEGVTIEVSVGGAAVVGPLPPGCVVEAETLRCDLADIAPGDVVTLPVTLAVGESSAEVTVEGTVSAANADPGSFSFGFAPAYVADLVVGVSAADTVEAGEELVFQVTVQNRGPSTAGDVVITFEVPAMVTITAGSLAAGACDLGSVPVTCTVPAIGAGSSVAVDLVAEVAADASGTVTMVIAVTAPASDPAIESNSVTVETSVTSSPVVVTSTTTSPPVVTSTTGAPPVVTSTTGAPPVVTSTTGAPVVTSTTQADDGAASSQGGDDLVGVTTTTLGGDAGATSTTLIDDDSAGATAAPGDGGGASGEPSGESSADGGPVAAAAEVSETVAEDDALISLVALTLLLAAIGGLFAVTDWRQGATEAAGGRRE